MPVTLEARKPVDQITATDLETYPIWEFALDEEGIQGRDETWIRPVGALAVPADAYSLSVSADFQTSSDHTLCGLVGVSTLGGVEFGHGAVFVDDKYFFVPALGYRLAKEPRAHLAKALQIREDKVFPLRFRLRVPIEGEAGLRTGVFE